MPFDEIPDDETLREEKFKCNIYSGVSSYKCSIHFEGRAKFCLKCVVQNLHFHPRKGVRAKFAC